MKILSILFLLFSSIRFYSQSLCELKKPQLIYNKSTQNYYIKDEIKPYKIVWYRNDTINKTSISYRTSPKQIISIPNFRHFKLCPHIQRNGDIFFVGDSLFNYSVFKVNLQNKTYDKQFCLTDYVTENRDYLDTLNYGVYGNTYKFNKDSSHDITNCFVMDNEGMMYIDKVYIKNFISLNPLNKTYKLIDSFSYPNISWINYSLDNFLYIYYDKTLFKSIELPPPYNRFINFSNPSYKADTLYKSYAALNYRPLTGAGLYRNKRFFLTDYYDIYNLNKDFDTALNHYITPLLYNLGGTSLVDGQGTIYLTKRLKSLSSYSQMHTDFVYTYNFILQKFDSVQMPKDSLLLSMVNSSVRIDCSGSLYAFGYLYKDDNDHLKGGRHTLNLYKQTAYIDSGLNHSFDSTLTAIVYYYDADSVILDSKNPKLYIDTNTCTQFSYRGKNYTQTGNYTDTFYNTTTGIDTILYIKITKNTTKYDTTKQTTCDSFIYKNTTYKNTGFYTFKYISSTKCDSLHTLALTLHKSTKDTTKAFSCSPYLWLDSLYKSTGVYSRTFKTALGCDSIKYLDLSIGLNNKVILSNGTYFTALQDNVSYQWYRCNPFRKIINETNKTFHTLTKGSYAVVVNDNKGCSDTSKCIDLYSSNLNANLDFKTRIYPNPFKTHFIVEMERLNKAIQIKLYDMTGKQILNNTYLNKDKIEINVESFSKGTYYLQIETETGNEFFNILKD